MKSKMIETLENCKGCKFVGLVYTSTLKLKKTGNPFKNDCVTKITRINCQFNYDYQTAVKNHLENSGNDSEAFEAGKLPFGSWAVYNKIIKYNENVYIRFYRLKNTTPQTVYFINGNLASEKEVETIKQFLPASSSSKKQSEAGLNDSEQVYPFNVNVDNILTLTIDKTTLKIH